MNVVDQQPRKKYDLEDRTFRYAKRVSQFCHKIQLTQLNIEYLKKCVKTSAAVGANYIAFNEAYNRKIAVIRLKLMRKDASEAMYWLRLLKEVENLQEGNEIDHLINESEELIKIVSSILIKIQRKPSTSKAKFHDMPSVEI